MAVQAVASRAVALAAKYGPQAVAAANQALAQATAGKAPTLEAVPTYVGSDPKKLSVAAQALARAGMSPEVFMPDDIIGKDRVLQTIRDGAAKLVTTLQVKNEAGADKTLSQTGDQMAADILRRSRVEAVREVFGTEAKYFLCMPNGGVPAADFVWYDTVIRGRR